MQANTVSLQHHLHTLHLLLSVDSLVHVGPGLSAAHAWYHGWAVPAVHWVEADATRHQFLQQQAKSGQQVHHALLGAEVLADATWHTLSNSNESGLLSLGSLSKLWPNLQSDGEHTQPQTTLDALLPVPTTLGNWLVVDCLPATRILQGACQQLAHTAVVVARVLNQQQPQLAGQGASLQELCDYLQPQGFTLLAQEEERHPAYSTVVLVRDYAGHYFQAQQKLALQVQACQELEAQLVQAQKAMQAEAKAKVELQSQFQAEQQEAAHRQQHRYQELEAQLAQAQKVIQNEAKAKAELQSQLQAEQQEAAHCRQQLKEEVGRAEAQLELLKELLLRDEVEPAFGNAGNAVE